jgi:ParB family chromosome partitioning protein
MLNPRVREPKKFALIVESIRTLGLKKPVTVCRRRDNDESYDLVCGQGRLEAFKQLGFSEIPAIIRGLSKTEAMLCSLVENIARRHVRAVDQIKTIGWMHQQDQSIASIATKTGLSEQYISNLLILLKHGEERLLDAVLHGRIPVSIAIEISGASDEQSQKILMDAYEKKEVNQKTLRAFRKLIEARRFLGREAERGGRKHHRERTSTAAMVQAYKRSVEKQRLFVRKARACESRLLSVAAAFKKLLADDHFLTLLKAENLRDLPESLIALVRTEKEVA